MPRLSLIFILLTIFACKQESGQNISDADINYIRTSSKIESDSDIESFIAPFRSEVSEEMDIVIGELPVDLYKSRPNSNLGNWFCDILEAKANEITGSEVAFAIQNYGGLRVPSIKAGPLTKREIFELMPFDNTFVILDVDGETMQKMLDHVADSEGWPISQGLNFRIDDSKAMDIKIHGEAFQKDKTYKVAMSDYIATGGDLAFLLKDEPQENLGVFIRGAIISYLENMKAQGESISIDNSKRIF